MRHFIYIDLEKAHVKAHFRRDSKTGKLLFIKDYDSKVHGKADAEYHKGHLVKVDNPRSKFHGQVMAVRHYSDKYDVVRLDIPGKNHTADFEPHMLIPHTGATPASPTSSSPVPVVAPPVSGAKTTLDDAKKILGVIGMSFTSADMQHERNRVDTMGTVQLGLRINKIKEDQKLYNFLRAVLEWGDSSKRAVLVPRIEQALIERAEKKKVASTPAATPVAKTTFDKGDRVRINNPRSKHHGKEGVVSSFSDKYNVVRMRLDDGAYTDASPAAVVNLTGASASSQPVTSPAKAPDKPKKVEPPKPVEPPKIASDFPHDKALAWKYATENQRSMARVTGMVPLDDGAAEYIKKNLNRILKSGKSSGSPGGYSAGYWRGTKTRTGYTVPKWVNDELNSTYRRIVHLKTLFRSNASKSLDINDKTIKENPYGVLFSSKADWENAGYDYDKEVKDVVEELQSDLKQGVEVSYRHKGFDVVNQLMRCAYERLVSQQPQTYISPMSSYMRDHLSPNTLISDVVQAFQNAPHASQFDGDDTATLMWAMCGPDHAKPLGQTTFGDFLDGYEKFVSGQANSSGPISGRKSYKTDDYVKYLIKHSKIADEALQMYFRNGAGIGSLFRHFNFYGDLHLNTVRFIRGDGLRTAPNAAGMPVYNVFNGSASSDVADNLSKEVIDRKVQGNNILRDQFGANLVAKAGSSNFSKNFDRKFNVRLFPKKLMANEGPRAIGTRIARMSGSVDSIVDGMSKKYWKEIENQKKLKAMGISLDSKADLEEPPPHNLGCTFQSVDQKMHDFIVKKISDAWDKNAHGGFFFKVHGIYKIGGMDHYDQYKKIEDDRDNIMFGYHSTNFASASGIVKTSYRASTGGMLGGGVYVTDISSKSAQYLNGNCNVTRRPGTRGVFLVNKISLGKVHDKSIGAKNNKKNEEPDISKADTIFAPKGKSVPGYSNVVLNDEHVVKDAKGVIPMYWVDMELTDRFGNT